jgi:hypothetical protein
MSIDKFIHELVAGLKFIGADVSFQEHCPDEIRISIGVRHTQMKLPTAKEQPEAVMGSPVRYTDGTISREYDEQPEAQGDGGGGFGPLHIISQEPKQQPSDKPLGYCRDDIPEMFKTGGGDFRVVTSGGGTYNIRLERHQR